jgi:hypothetical protein
LDKVTGLFSDHLSPLRHTALSTIGLR